jgi:hypothetical protein
MKRGQKYKDDTICCFVSENQKWGVLAMNEANIYEEILAPIYDTSYYVESHDLIVAGNYKNGKFTLGGNSYYLFRANGQKVAAFDNIDYLIFENSGNIMVIKNTKYGVLDENYQFGIPCEYHLLTTLSKDLFAFEKLNLDEPEKNKEEYENANGIVNRKNEIIAAFYFTFRVCPHLYLNAVIVGTGDEWLIEKEYFAFNVLSRIKIPLPFEKIFDTQSYHYHYKSQPLFRTVIETIPGYVNFMIDGRDSDFYIIGKWGVVFPNGEVAIPNEYDYIERISADYFKFCVGIPVVEEDVEEQTLYLKNVKWGIIDISNKIILDAEFDWILMNEERGVFITNKGGIVFWDERQPKPEWEIDGGVFEYVEPEQI